MKKLKGHHFETWINENRFDISALKGFRLLRFKVPYKKEEMILKVTFQRILSVRTFVTYFVHESNISEIMIARLSKKKKKLHFG